MELSWNSHLRTAISSLGPGLPSPDSQVIQGEVTVIWPYNSIKDSLAFLLSEPDIRLRRTKGQVRIQLNGSSAKSVASCGFGSGDELVISLEGVEWAKDESAVKLPGSRVEWQLNYSERLLLQVCVPRPTPRASLCKEYVLNCRRRSGTANRTKSN